MYPSYGPAIHNTDRRSFEFRAFGGSGNTSPELGIQLKPQTIGPYIIRGLFLDSIHGFWRLWDYIRPGDPKSRHLAPGSAASSSIWAVEMPLWKPSKTWPGPTCVCTYIYIHRYVYVYIYIHIYICIYVYICIHIHVYIHMCIYICIYVNIYACVYIYIYVCTCICMYVCMYVCIYI